MVIIVKDLEGVEKVSVDKNDEVHTEFISNLCFKRILINLCFYLVFL